MGRLRVGGCCLVLFLLVSLVGCTGSRRPAASPSGSPATRAWEITDLHPIGQVESADGVAVGYVRDGRTLLLAGIDPATGTLLWRQPAALGRVTPGIPVEPKVIDQHVVYFRKGAPNVHGSAVLVVGDAKTGKDLATAGPAIFTSTPEACSNDKDVCTFSTFSENSAATAHRLVVATGKYVDDLGASLPPGARLIGDKGLIDLGIRPNEQIGLYREGRFLWRRAVSEAFPAGFSTDNGWLWRLDSERHVYLGSIHADSTVTADARTRQFATEDAMAALSEDGGRVLWRDTGSAHNCYGNLGDEKHPVRCRSKGSVTFRTGSSPTFDGLDVTIEGFNPLTGEVTWRVPVGAAGSLVGAREKPIRAGANEVVLSGGGDPVIVDYVAGTKRVAPADAVYWCVTPVRFDNEQPYYYDDKAYYERNGGDLAATCDRGGRPVTDGRWPAGQVTVDVSGERFGSIAVVATEQGYAGFKV